MIRQPLHAQQYGIWSALPPATDNPAACLPPMPQNVRARLAVLRAEAFARYALQVRRAPDCWHWHHGFAPVAQ